MTPFFEKEVIKPQSKFLTCDDLFKKKKKSRETLNLILYGNKFAYLVRQFPLLIEVRIIINSC